MKPHFIPLTCALFLIAAASAPAAILAQYRFDSGAVTSSDSDANSTAGSFSVNNGDPAGTGAGFSTTSHMAFFRSDGLTASESGAVAAPDYFQFTFTPTTGSYQLTSLTLQFGGSSSTAATGAFTSHLSLRSDAEATDFSTNIGTLSKAINNASADNQLEGMSIDLSGIPEFQNVTSAVTFRFYVYGEDAGLSTEILRMDSVVLNGSLIPEPSTALLGMIAAMTGLARRRRSGN